MTKARYVCVMTRRTTGHLRMKRWEREDVEVILKQYLRSFPPYEASTSDSATSMVEYLRPDNDMANHTYRSLLPQIHRAKNSRAFLRRPDLSTQGPKTT